MLHTVKQVLVAATALFTVSVWSERPSTDGPRVSRVVSHLTPNEDNAVDSDFLRLRQRTGTRLLRAAPAPDLYKDPAAREGVRLVRYASDGNELKVWLLSPAHTQLWTAQGYPVVVYVHDGTSFSDDELVQASQFSDAGFLVFAPTFRGENGNPGNHELLFGELDDLVAAVGYVSSLPDVDGSRIAVWGHGLGGMLSALSSLVPKLPVQYTGSSAGVRPPSTFEVLQKPFEDSERERSLRILGPNLQHMRTPHWACVAEQDLAVDAEAKALGDLAMELKVPLQVERVNGNRASSRAECTSRVVRFLLQSFAPPSQTAPH